MPTQPHVGLRHMCAANERRQTCRMCTVHEQTAFAPDRRGKPEKCTTVSSYASCSTAHTRHATMTTTTTTNTPKHSRIHTFHTLRVQRAVCGTRTRRTLRRIRDYLRFEAPGLNPMHACVCMCVCVLLCVYYASGWIARQTRNYKDFNPVTEFVCLVTELGD